MKPCLRPLLLLALMSVTLAAAGDAPRIEVQALFKNKAVMLIDGKRRVLGAGESSPEGVTLLSATARGARIRVDGQERDLALGTRIGSSFTGPREQQVRVVADAQGMYLARGSIDGVPVRFLLDTGATVVSMSQVLADRIGLDYHAGEEGHSVTASGVAPVWRVRLRKVKLGAIELADVEAAVHQGEFPPLPLLGNSFLSRVEIVQSGSALLLSRRY